MPDQPVRRANNAQGEDEGGFRKFLGIAQQILIAWTVMQLVTKFFAPPASKNAAPELKDLTPEKAADNARLPPQTVSLSPDWKLGETLDMHIFISTSTNGDIFNKRSQKTNFPYIKWENITFADWNDYRSAEYEIQIPSSVKNNGSLFADIILTKGHATPDYTSKSFDPTKVHHYRRLLTPYLAKAKIRKEKNLLSGPDEAKVEDEPEQPDVIVPHWHQNFTLALISQNNTLQYMSLPAPLLEHINLIPDQRDKTGTVGWHKPIIFQNEFWNLRSQYTEINSSTTTLPLYISFQPMSYFKFQLYASMTHGFNEAAKQQGGGATAELDEVKRMLTETQPWLLILTGAVSVLHVVFEMLAFKNDVSHWRQKKEMVGVSVRTIVTNVFVQTIILLYLIDNNENTSWMILFGSGMGVLIEAWKITKAVDIAIVAAPVGSILPYKLDITDKHVLSEDEKKTQEYDKLAFRYVSYVAIPLLIGYSIYSLVYESHRGWYSFIISTLTSFVYMFGFAQLVPQLIINYKLKSVAHMPIKAMIYKTLSTVVDDFFAFCIKMPFLHRLACFRDDVVFLIFLYQRWIYRIDYSRANEYGQLHSEDADAMDKSGESKKDK